MKNKTCFICKKNFLPTGYCQKFCPECKQEARKSSWSKYGKEYRNIHKEEIKTRMKKYNLRPEIIIKRTEYLKKYFASPKVKVKQREYQKKYSQEKMLKIDNRCSDCGKLISPDAQRCIYCLAKTRITHGGSLIKHYCIDCKKQILSMTFKTKRCRKCNQKWQVGKNNPFYGKKHTSKTIKKLRKIKQYSLNEKLLLDLYINQKNNLRQLAKYFTCSQSAIYRRLILLKVSIRKNDFKGKNNPNFGNKYSEKTKDLIRQNTIKNIKLGKYDFKPNKPEKIIIKLLNDLSFKNYKYAGNGTCWITNFNPDFIDKKNKKIIELFGTYWHNLQTAQNRDILRLKAYKKYGYKTLIIWEHELKDIPKVITKLIKFNKGKENEN